MPTLSLQTPAHRGGHIGRVHQATVSGAGWSHVALYTIRCPLHAIQMLRRRDTFTQIVLDTLDYNTAVYMAAPFSRTVAQLHSRRAFYSYLFIYKEEEEEPSFSLGCTFNLSIFSPHQFAWCAAIYVYTPHTHTWINMMLAFWRMGATWGEAIFIFFPFCLQLGEIFHCIGR